MKTKLLILGIIICFASCNEINDKKLPQDTNVIVEFKNGKQRLTINQSDEYGNVIINDSLIILGKQTINVGEKAIFKITTRNSKYKIVRAYFDCNTNQDTYVDTLQYKISNCNKQLEVKNGTINVYFTPTISGEKQFEEITAVTIDSLGYLRAVKGSFVYFVKD